jgi:hypothetical protein
MTDSSEFKQLVRQRMEATGEKYTTAYRALLDAARPEVLPSKLQVLPRISARYLHSPRPSVVRLRLFHTADLDLDAEELQRYVTADAGQQYELVYEWLVERLQDFAYFEELVSDHDVAYEDEEETRGARWEASYLGITADQYAWLVERLTNEEFERLSEEDMRLLLAREYTPYPTPE